MNILIIDDEPIIANTVFTPVSYTHLDVYKRQESDGPVPEYLRYVSGNPEEGVCHGR